LTINGTLSLNIPLAHSLLPSPPSPPAPSPSTTSLQGQRGSTAPDPYNPSSPSSLPNSPATPLSQGDLSQKSTRHKESYGQGDKEGPRSLALPFQSFLPVADTDVLADVMLQLGCSFGDNYFSYTFYPLPPVSISYCLLSN
jgi:hypothetical protein